MIRLGIALCLLSCAGNARLHQLQVAEGPVRSNMDSVSFCTADLDRKVIQGTRYLCIGRNTWNLLAATPPDFFSAFSVHKASCISTKRTFQSVLAIHSVAPCVSSTARMHCKAGSIERRRGHEQRPFEATRRS